MRSILDAALGSGAHPGPPPAPEPVPAAPAKSTVRRHDARDPSTGRFVATVHKVVRVRNGKVLR